MSDAVLDMIKEFETNIRLIPVEQQSSVRRAIANMYSYNIMNSFRMSNNVVDLIRDLRYTKTYFKENPSIVCVKAYKGEASVLIEREDYINEMKNVLDDNETYEIVAKYPTSRIIRELSELLKKWCDCKYIERSTYLRLYPRCMILPR